MGYLGSRHLQASGAMAALPVYHLIRYNYHMHTSHHISRSSTHPLILLLPSTSFPPPLYLICPSLTSRLIVSTLPSTDVFAMPSYFFLNASTSSLPSSTSGCSHVNVYVIYSSLPSCAGPVEIVLVTRLPSSMW